MNAKEYKSNYSLRYTPDIFKSLENAKSFSSHAVKTQWVVMGFVGQYLVVCPADAQRLIKNGFELI